MKILWLHSHFLYPTGGTRFIYEIVTRLKKYHEISVIVEKASPEYIKKFANMEIPLQQISSKTSSDTSYWLLLPFYMNMEKKKLQQKIANSDVIITSIFPMHYLASFYDKPTIYYCFEPFAFFYDQALLSKLPFIKKFGSYLLKLAFEASDKKGIAHAESIMTFNRAVEKWIKKVYDRSVDKITYMGVNSDLFKRIKAPKPPKWANNLVLLHSTDFTAMKGTEYLINAMALIVRKFPNVKLIISQTLEDKLAKRRYELMIDKYNLKNQIEFIGTIPAAKLPTYYSLADIYCFSADPQSIGTTASLSVLEAMSCELPVVRSIGNDEEIIHGESGFLADPRNSREYASYVLKLLANKDLRQKMGRAGRLRILKFYHWDKVVNIFLEELHKINLHP